MNTSHLCKSLLFGSVLVGTTALVTTQVVSQNIKEDLKKGIQKQVGEVVDQAQEDMAKMWETWAKYAEPGDVHTQMAQAVGEWDNDNTIWMAPGAEPMKSTSMSTMKTILGGRFMMETLKGKVDFGAGPMEMEGLGIFGYDNYTEMHTFVWMDNMGTMMMIGEGSQDASGAVTYKSRFADPMTGKMKDIKSVSRVESKDKHVFEMYEKLDDGSWHLHFEAVGTRRN